MLDFKWKQLMVKTENLGRVRGVKYEFYPTMSHKHNQRKGIKKTSPNDPKKTCSSSLVIIWMFLLSRQSFRNKTQEKKILNKKQIINVRSKGTTPSFSKRTGQLSPVKKSVKAMKSVIIENSESFKKCFVLTF